MGMMMPNGREIEYKPADEFLRFHHPLDWVKLEPAEIIRNLHVLEQRFAHIEKYLETGAKQPYVRFAENPVAGHSASAIVHSLGSRLEALEHKLGLSKG